MESSVTLVEPNGKSRTEVSDAEGACSKTSLDNLFVIPSLTNFLKCAQYHQFPVLKFTLFLIQTFNTEI